MASYCIKHPEKRTKRTNKNRDSNIFGIPPALTWITASPNRGCFSSVVFNRRGRVAVMMVTVVVVMCKAGCNLGLGTWDWGLGTWDRGLWDRGTSSSRRAASKINTAKTSPDPSNSSSWSCSWLRRRQPVAPRARGDQRS